MAQFTVTLLVVAVSLSTVAMASSTPPRATAKLPAPPTSNVRQNTSILFADGPRVGAQGWDFSYHAFDIRQVANNKYASQGINGCSNAGSPVGWPFKLAGDKFMHGYEGKYWNADSSCPQITIEQYVGQLELLGADWSWHNIGTKPPAFGSSAGLCVHFVPHEDPFRATQGQGHVEVKGGVVSSFDYMMVLINPANDKVHNIVDFNLPNAAVTNKPLQVAQEFLNNESPTSESMGFTFSQTVSTTKTFSFSATQGITVGTEFVTKIPFIAEGKISTEISASFTEGGTHSSMDSQTLSANFPIVVPGHKCYTSFAKVTSSVVDVDVLYSVSRNYATAVMLGTDNFQTCSMAGDTMVKAHYTGVNCWDLGYDVKDHCDHGAVPRLNSDEVVV